jgi:hypothetical protein
MTTYARIAVCGRRQRTHARPGGLEKAGVKMVNPSWTE